MRNDFVNAWRYSFRDGDNFVDMRLRELPKIRDGKTRVTVRHDQKTSIYDILSPDFDDFCRWVFEIWEIDTSVMGYDGDGDGYEWWRGEAVGTMDKKEIVISWN